MKIRQRVISLLIVLCLVVGMLPVTASAEGAGAGKAIQLGIGEVSGYSSANGYDYIYYGGWDYGTGNTPVKWRVLDDQTNMDTEGLFLLTDELLGTGDNGGVMFDEEGNSNVWQGSDAQNWCISYYQNYLSSIEQNSVMSTTKNDSEYVSGNNSFGEGNEILKNDKVFFLSAEEAESADYGFSDSNSRKAYYNGSPESWWLRSRSINTDNVTGPIWAGIMFYILGQAIHGNVDGPNCARPAFNLDTSTVLFTAAAVNGKPTGTIFGTLSTVAEYTGNEWKLTLLDSNRSFTANVDGQTSVSAAAGGSVQITYSGAQTGDNEYVSVLLCDSNGNVLHYGNIAQNSASGAATLNVPSGFAAGSYTLKVFSEQCNGDYKTDYASAFQNISLTILPQEATPQAAFTATSDNGGTLSNVETGMKYSTDGGTNWNDITSTSMEITGVTAANDVKVYKPGDGTTTSDSEVQTIDVTQAAQPTVSGADCTTSAQNNGQITGVDNTMEYRLSTASEWTGITGTEVTGLSDGTYEVRVKANGTALASTAASVTIGAHTCVAQGEWLHDETNHWKLCTCGAKVDTAAHSGGTATCRLSAVCAVCGQSYGEKDMNNHTGIEAWKISDTGHTKVWDCCETVIEAEEEHTWANGACTVCGTPCTHTGGTATCSQLAVCELCGSLYGDYDPDNHLAVSAWTQENGMHYHKCVYGCDTHLDKAACSGGTATCAAKAVCETCGAAYGELNPANHTNLVKTEEKPATHLAEGNTEYWYCDGCGRYFRDAAGTEEIDLADTVLPKLPEHTSDGTGWRSDETNHWNTCACGEQLNTAAHTFAWITDKEATATENGSKHEECTVCGYALQAVEVPATGTATPAPTTTPAPTATAAPTATPAPTATTAPTATPAPTAEPGLGPKTGDPGVSALWFAAPAVSGLGLAAVCRRRRRGTR